MNISTLALMGLCSAFFCGLGIVIYVRNILQGKTKPERASWWIWTILMLVALAAQAAAGSTWSLLLTGALFVGNVTIALLSLHFGYGRFKMRDYLAVLMTFIGLYLWKITNNPLAALLVIIVIDFLGNVLTMVKSWRAPYSENLQAWIFTTTGAFFGIFAVGSLNGARLLFPVYLVFANLMTIGVIQYRRKWRANKIAAGRKRSSRLAP